MYNKGLGRQDWGVIWVDEASKVLEVEKGIPRSMKWSHSFPFVGRGFPVPPVLFMCDLQFSRVSTTHLTWNMSPARDQASLIHISYTTVATNFLPILA